MHITIIRTAIMYLFLILIMRLMGKRQIGQLQPGELVITILISEIAAIPIQDRENTIIQAVIPIVILALLEIAVSFLSLKSIKIRTLLQGNSIVVIKNGKPDKKQMKRLRFSIDDLIEALRKKDIFNIKDVQYAIVETDGSLSILLKPEKRPATVSDTDAEITDTGLPVTLISDGRYIDKKIAESVLSKGEIEKLLKKKHIGRKQVLLLTADESGNIEIIK